MNNQRMPGANIDSVEARGEEREVHLRRLRGLIVSALLLATPLVAMAGGFNIYEMGGRATALGGAFTATADDPSAIFYNPAGTAFLHRGWEVSLNVSPTFPNNKFARASGVTERLYPGDATGETKDNIFFPSGAYITYRRDEHWSGGFGFFTPFGLGVEWQNQDTFSGRSVATNSQIQGLYFSPVITYSPEPSFAMSVGANFVKTSLTLENIATQPFGTNNDALNIMNVKLDGSANWAASASAAILWKPTEKMNFGINYKGGVTNEFENEGASFTQIMTGVSSIDDAVAPLVAAYDRMDVSGKLNFPAIVSTGARIQATENLALMADFVWFDWSSFRNVNLELASDTDTLSEQLREDYTDGQAWRFGGEYQITPSLRGMAGLVIDNSPQPVGSVSPILPDADRIDYSFGFTYTAEHFELTAAYMLVNFDERSTVVDGVGHSYDGFDGSYDSVAHIPSVGATYHF